MGRVPPYIKGSTDCMKQRKKGTRDFDGTRFYKLGSDIKMKIWIENKKIGKRNIVCFYGCFVYDYVFHKLYLVYKS